MKDFAAETLEMDEHDEVDRLKTEIVILKSELERLNKNNHRLRIGQSELYKSMYEKDAEMKQRMRLIERDNQLKDSQMSFASSGQKVSAGIDIRYALRDFINMRKLSSATFIEGLKFFRDYFFDEFYSLDLTDVIHAIQTSSLSNEAFVQLFLLFGSRKEFFDIFHFRFFGLPGFVSDKQCVIENVPVDWLLDSNQVFYSGVSHFLRERSGTLIEFYICIATKRPSVLKLALSEVKFTEIVKSKRGQWWQLACAVCKSSGAQYITPHNLHLLPKEALRLYFAAEYVDLEFPA